MGLYIHNPYIYIYKVDDDPFIILGNDGSLGPRNSFHIYIYAIQFNWT